MSNIIIAFSKRENAVNIRNILARSGIDVPAVCTTGAKILQYAELWDEGIIVCGCRLQDMQYMQLKELLPERFDMLLIASAAKWSDGLPDGIVGLPVPLKGYDLVNTVEMLLANHERFRKKKKKVVGQRDAAGRKYIEQAKAVLMERNNMTEDEAHRYLQKTSMESGTNMSETAQMILSIMKG